MKEYEGFTEKDLNDLIDKMIGVEGILPYSTPKLTPCVNGDNVITSWMVENGEHKMFCGWGLIYDMIDSYPEIKDEVNKFLKEDDKIK